MTYSLQTKFYNSAENKFFDTDPANAGQLVDLYTMNASIQLKNNADWQAFTDTVEQDSDGTWVRTLTHSGFASIDAAETKYNDILNATFWQNAIFEYHKEHQIKTKTEILGPDSVPVKLLHDNRSITIAGSGPASWAPYLPE